MTGLITTRRGWRGLRRSALPVAAGLAIALAACIELLGQVGAPVLAESSPQAAAIVPGTVRVANVTYATFAVSWMSTEAVTGAVRYGTWPQSLSQTATDDLSGVRRAHHVSPGFTGQELMPDTWYYYDILSGSGIDDNGGVHYIQATGPVLLELPDPEPRLRGAVLTGTGAPAPGSLVYLNLLDGDGAGSPGRSAPQSLVAEGGYWGLSGGSMREGDLAAYFGVLTSTDRLELAVQGDPDGWARGQYGVYEAVDPMSRTITITTGILPAPAAPAPLPGPNGPDLVIESIQASSGYPVAGCSAAITVTVRNAGNAAVTAPFRVALYLDHSRVPYPGERSNTNTWWTVEGGLAPSATVTVSSLMPAQASGAITRLMAAGRHTIYAQADSYGNQVAELNEENNQTGPFSLDALGGCVLYRYLPSLARW